MNRPNVIHIIAHDLGKEIGLYGAGFSTPNLDSFGRAGVTFNQCYCTSTACSPSRGCGMTGQTAHTNGLVGLANPGALWHMPLATRTMVDDFNDAGYETAHSGMQHERFRKEHNRYQNELPSSGWVEDAVDGAIGFLENRPAGASPFYLNIGTNEVHSGQWETYKFDRKVSRAAVYGTVDPQTVRMPSFVPDLPLLRREWAAFAGCVSYWDSQVGRLLDTIERLGYYENTIVLITTDHGVAAHRVKSTLYKEGVEITLLMRIPGGRPGVTVESMVQNTDLLPTLMDACGIPVRSDIEGRSLWPLLSGGEYTPYDHVCLERNFHGNFDPMRAIRTEDYALIRNFDLSKTLHYTPDQVTHTKDSYHRWFTELWPDTVEPCPEFELFDRRRDPAERINVAGEAAYERVLDDLKAKLASWMEKTNDPLLEATDEEGFTRVVRERFEYIEDDR
ncbi:MAG: sulfatase-like hydrolase/transferase [Chitinivibrionales bacterium]|nr:sulfatase-like hydrolase/transferase [Chitinivibrionales bacterium]